MHPYSSPHGLNIACVGRLTGIEFHKTLGNSQSNSDRLWVTLSGLSLEP